MRHTAARAFRLLSALILGVPAGLAADIAWQAASHPGWRALLGAHPLWAIPALALPGALAGAGLATGFGPPGGTLALQWWMAAAAAAAFLWSDRPW